MSLSQPVPPPRRRYAKTQQLADVVLDVFATFNGPMATRQVFYQCVSRLAVENNPQAYERVQRLVVELRRDGAVPYSRVVDRTRRVLKVQTWDSPEDIICAAASGFKLDPWETQDTVVMIGCEKQALEGIFCEITEEYRVPLWVVRGFGSITQYFDWAESIRAVTASGRKCVVAYFGDHDPSGLSISEKVREELAGHGAEFEFQRAGLLFEDIARYEIPALPVKRTDTRAKGYLTRFGDVGAELDALRPDVLQDRVAGVIKAHIDPGRWDATMAAEEEQRVGLNSISANFAAAVKGATAENDNAR